MKLITALVPQELVEAIDSEIRRMREERKGVKISRADFIREVLYKAVDLKEAAE